MRSRVTSTFLVLALSSVLLGASWGCAGGSTEADGPDQMHGNAALPSGETTEDVSAYQEVPMYVSDVKVSGNEVAVITTPKGVIKLKFFPDVAPNHVASFIELSDAGFYDGTKFHRVEPGFVVQGGDPYSKTGEGPVGTGGPGYNLAAEFSDKPHVKGTLAMARSQSPDSAGSQFYICLEPAPFLDGQYTVFGEVVEGMGVVESLQVGDVIESIVIER